MGSPFSAAEAHAPLGVKFIPQTVPEWTAFSVVALLAGVAEEAAYRGVALVLLTRATGSLGDLVRGRPEAFLP